MTTRKLARSITRLRSAYRIGYEPDRGAENITTALRAISELELAGDPEQLATIDAILADILEILREHPTSRSDAARSSLIELAISDLIVELPDARSALHDTLAACISEPQALSNHQRSLLWDASSRRDAFSTEQRLAYKLLCFPHNAVITGKLLRAATFHPNSTILIDFFHKLFELRDADLDAALKLVNALTLAIPDELVASLLKQVSTPEAASFLCEALGERILIERRWHGLELFDLFSRTASLDAAPVIAWIALEGSPHHTERACELLTTIGSRDDLAALDLVRELAWNPSCVATASIARSECSEREPPTSARYTSLRALASRHRAPSGWTFQERQTMHHFESLSELGPRRTRSKRPPEDVVDEFYRILSDKVTLLSDTASTQNLEDIDAAFSHVMSTSGSYPERARSLAHIALAASNGRLGELAVDTLYGLAIRGELRTTPEDADRYISSSSTYDSNDPQHAMLLVCALPHHLDAYTDFIDAFGFDLVPHQTHRHILNSTDPDLSKSALEAFYTRCSETQLRGLFASLDVTDFEHLFPTWIQLAHRVTPSTRQIINARLAETMSRALEPYFARTAEDQDEDHQIRSDAILALGQVGTRASVALLAKLESERRYRAAASTALERIEDRYPASEYADAGSLSLAADDGHAGALSEVHDTEHALSLYREDRVTARAEHNPAPSEPAALERAQRADISRLAAPPRDTNMITVTYAALGSSWRRVIATPLFAFGTAGTILLNPIDPTLSLLPLSLTTLGIMAFVASLVDFQPREDLKLLKYGYIGMARLVNIETEWTGLGTQRKPTHHYTFRYTTEAGSPRDLVHSTGSLAPELEDEELEPILYILDDDNNVSLERPLDAITRAQIGARGTPLPNRRARWLLFLHAMSVVLSIVALILF